MTQLSLLDIQLAARRDELLRQYAPPQLVGTIDDMEGFTDQLEKLLDVMTAMEGYLRQGKLVRIYESNGTLWMTVY